MKNIYVEILEGSAVPVFVPVNASFFGENFFKISAFERKDLDSLKFKEGDFVFCIKGKLENIDELVWIAYSSISEEAVKYLTKV